MNSLLVKPTASDGDVVRVTQQSAGWQTVSLRVLRLSGGEARAISQPGEELALVMLGGRAAVRAGGERWESLGERASVFAGMPHTLYLPAGTEGVEIEALTDPCEVAVCG